ncbi:MAG: PDZ domain-containing protein [Proteobacteria bacterium]|nr:PDZ domain-containing protein [Pseudomonadota bacterium]
MKKLSVVLLFMTLLLASSAFAYDNKPRLGLNVSALQASPLLLQHLRLSEGEGLMVSNIAVGGELEAAGLSQGDIVLAIDGHSLSKPADLQNYVAKLPLHASVTLDVIQKGEHKQIILKLDSLPDEVVWKYSQPVSGPGRPAPLRKQLLTPVLPQGQQSPQIHAPSHGGLAQSGSQRLTFKSVMSTEEGIKSSTVTIIGSPQDSNSEIEIELGSDTYKTRLGDIDQLPEDAQRAARNAIQQSNQFSFSFGSGSQRMDDMMKRHQEQMRMMDELFFRSFGGQQMMPPSGGQPQAPESNVLRPVQPSAEDIKL